MQLNAVALKSRPEGFEALGQVSLLQVPRMRGPLSLSASVTKTCATKTFRLDRIARQAPLDRLRLSF